MLRSTVFALLVAIGTVFLAVPVSRAQATVSQFDIPSQPLAEALRAIGSQTNTNVLFDPPLVEGRDAPALKAEVTLDQAFAWVLAGTGLKHRFLDHRTVMVVSASAATEAAAPAPALTRLAQVEQTEPTRPVTERENAPTQESAPADSPESVSGDNLQEIVVTGSRLARGGFEAPTPVTVVSQEWIASKGVANIADVLSTVPNFRQTAGTTQAPRLSLTGVGQSLLDLRGLGANRTLVLIDTQRIVPSNTNGTFDVNQIPSFLVDRVDVVTGGASAAYGSDAVAGVVNFILRRRMNGVETSGHYGMSEYGDNIEQAMNFAAGADFLDGRVHALLGVDYSDNKGVGSMYERSWGRAEPALFGTGTSRAPGVPAQLLATDAQLNNITPGGIINTGPLTGTAFGPSGVPYAFQYGTIYGTWMTGSDANYGNGTFGHYKLKTPIERVSTLGRLSIDVTDALSLTANVGYARSTVDSFGSYHQWPSIVIDSSNPFIPVATRAEMAARNLSTITIGRNSRDINDGFTTKGGDETKWGSLQAEGSIGASWKWDAYYGMGRSTYTVRSTNLAIVPNFFAAVYAVPGPDGAPVCGPVATIPNLTPAQRLLVQPGCVPINLFGEGSPSDAAIDYVTGDLVNEYFMKQQSAALNVRGTPFSLWAGPLSLAVGSEWRKDSIDSDIDPLALAGAWYSSNAQPLVGKNTVKEAYAEFAAPLFKDQPFGNYLELNGAVRRTDYDVSGKVTTWKGGLSYDLNEMIRLRGTRSRDIRAPTLSELFSAGTESRAGLINPFNGQSSATTVVFTGNINLTPEKADTTTFGVVLRPDFGFLSDLQLSVDYYDIEVKDVITSLTAQQILAACFAGVQQFCSAIQFDNSVFGIALLAAQPFNASQLHTKGFDFELAYRLPFDAMGLPGQFDIRALATLVRKLETNAPNGTFDYVGYGASGVPEWTYNLNLNYRLNPMTISANFHGFSSIKYDVTLIGPDDPSYSPTLPNSISDNTLPSKMYLDLGARFSILQRDSGSLELFGNIDNVLNSGPPQFASVTLNSGGNPYDMIGRTYRLGVKVTF